MRMAAAATDRAFVCGKISLQEFADEINIPITVCHYPPGTSKWNPIEHRMFAPISANWRAKLLRSFNDATQYIRATTTKTGLTIEQSFTSPHLHLARDAGLVGV